MNITTRKISAMEKIVNKIHFCFYLIDTKLHSISNSFNPFRLLYKIPYIKKRDKKLGITRDEVLNNTFTDKQFGISIMVSGGVLIAFVFLLLFSIINYSIKLFSLDFILNKEIFISISILSFLICYFLVFRNDKYLKYFKEFKRWNETKKRRNVIKSVIVSLLLIIIFFISLV